MRLKASDHPACGSRLAGVLRSPEWTGLVYRPNAATMTLRESGMLEAEDVRPGFSVLVSDLFS